jgi:hypothetical protein
VRDCNYKLAFAKLMGYFSITMYKYFLAGLLSGCTLTFLLFRGKLGDHCGKTIRGERHMTQEEKVISDMNKVIREHPEAATPDHNFLRSWAFGNAGLEDERITEEQVETVLRQKSA